MISTTQKGRWGEALALRFLELHQYHILTQNWRAGRGEIDIIAKDTDGTLIFIEVKARASLLYGSPEESITPAKQRMLRGAISAYLAKNRVHKFRVDVVSILKTQSKTTIKHLKDVELCS
jgi:putative endonuclease